MRLIEERVPRKMRCKKIEVKPRTRWKDQIRKNIEVKGEMIRNARQQEVEE